MTTVDKDVRNDNDVEAKLLKPEENVGTSRRGTRNQLILTACVLLLTTACGMPIGYSTVILPQLYNTTDPLAINLEIGSWIASIHSAASPIGSFISGSLMERFGRKPTLIGSAVPLIIGWVMIANAGSHMILLVGRTVVGIAVGLISAPAKVLVAESAHPNLRGSLVGAPFAAYSVGICLVYVLRAVFSWRVVAWCSIILPILSIISISLIFESPVWLAQKEQYDKCQQALNWLRGGSRYADKEFEQLKHRLILEKETRTINSVKENEGFCKLIARKNILKPMIAINGFALFQNVSGTYIFVFYAVTIISEFGANVNANQIAVVTAVLRVIVAFFFCFLLLHVNRRTMIIYSGLGSSISAFVLAVFIFIRLHHEKTSFDLYVAYVCIFVYIASNTGFMIMPGLLVGELLPANVRGLFSGYVFTFLNLNLFGFTKVFPFLQIFLKSQGTFLLFGIGSFGVTVLLYYLLPETQGKTLHEIEDYYNGDNWIWQNRPKTPIVTFIRNNNIKENEVTTK